MPPPAPEPTMTASYCLAFFLTWSDPIFSLVFKVWLGSVNVGNKKLRHSNSYVCNMRYFLLILVFNIFVQNSLAQSRKRLREWGVRVGVLSTGPNNAITDVKGV